MKKLSNLMLIFAILLELISVKAYADTNEIDINKAYETGISKRIITPKEVTLQDFTKLCNDSVIPVFNEAKKSQPNLSFQQFIQDDNYEQPISDIDGDVHNLRTSLTYNTTTAKKGYNMKAGDILVVYGKNVSSRFIGHAAIATSDKYLLEMQGPGHKSVHTSKETFFKRNTGKGSYVLTYRINKHPVYAKSAASYAWNHMYKEVSPSYAITTHLYHKDPSYCSKYVYLSYYWGATKSAVKKWPEYTHIVTPHGLTGNFVGSFKPTCIHKITGY